MRTSTATLITIAAVGSLATAVGESSASSRPAAELDEPTIVAIFDAANTADIETGEMAAERGQVAPAFQTHMPAAQNLEKQLAASTPAK